MKCEHIIERLDEYVDGELSPADREAVEQHLASCDACRAEHDALRETVDLVRHLPRTEPAFSLAPRVRAVLERQPARRRSPLLRWAGVGGWIAAAASLLVVVKLVSWDGVSPTDTRPALTHTVETETSLAAGRRGSDNIEEKAAGADADVARQTAPPPSVALLDAAAPAEKAARSAAEGAGAGEVADDARYKADARDEADVEPEFAAKSGVGPLAQEDAARADAEKEAAPPAEYVFQCADLEAGREQVSKAVAAAGGTVQGDEVEADRVEGDEANVVLATVPAAKLNALLAELSLLPEPEPEPAAEGQAVEELEEAARDAAENKAPAELGAAQQALPDDKDLAKRVEQNDAPGAPEAAQQARTEAEQAAEDSVRDATSQAAERHEAATKPAAPPPPVLVKIILRTETDTQPAAEAQHD